MRIAALDVETSEIELIQLAMTEIGHECHGFDDAASLQREMRDPGYDLLILAWSLADVQGVRIVKWVREELGSLIPVLFVAHRHEGKHMIEALAAGADDFMVKPIRTAELQARVSALIRRAYPPKTETELIVGPYRFLLGTHSLEINGRESDLNHREYELALFLFKNLGRLVSREHLLDVLWGKDLETGSRSLDTHISRVRIKLKLHPSRGILLSAVYGLGYRLELLDGDVLAQLQTQRRMAA